MINPKWKLILQIKKLYLLKYTSVNIYLNHGVYLYSYFRRKEILHW